MKLAQILSVFLCVFVMTSCSQCVPTSTQPQGMETYATSATGIDIPDAMIEYADDPMVQWMAGIVVGIENAEMIQGISQESFEVYSNPGDKINAVILVQNGLDKTQRFDLMVFADGVPVEFSTNGEIYNSYSIDLTPWQKMIEIEFEKDFTLNMGRLDFVMSYSENPHEDFHLVTYTVWVDLANEPLQPAKLCSVVNQRVGVEGMYGGGAYNAWFWNGGASPSETEGLGPRTISFRDNETVLLEAIASQPGYYRTVVVVNGKPMHFDIDGVNHAYIDWESKGTNMLQMPITLSEIPSSGYIYTVTTPLTTENRSQFVVASGMIELVPDTEE